jgi:hypothetical protein
MRLAELIAEQLVNILVSLIMILKDERLAEYKLG